MTDYICSRDYKKACGFFTKLCRTITISPPDKKKKDDANTHHYTIYSKIHSALKHAVSEYILIPEYANYTARLHFHGVIKFRTNMQLDNFMRKANMRMIQKTIGQIKIDGVPHPRWIEYMFKDNELTRKMQYRYTIIDDTEMFVPLNISVSMFGDEDPSDEEEIPDGNEH